MKTFFAPLFEPLGALGLLMALGVLWLVFRRQWRTALWLGVPTGLIWLLGSTPLVDTLVERAERPYAGVVVAKLAPADAVVALGGGHGISPFEVLGLSIGPAGSRVLAAVELVRLGRAKTLVLGGGWPVEGPGNVSLPDRLQAWLASWHLTGGSVTNLGPCWNTHDEAVRFRQLRDQHHWRRVILVTSALHLRRSVAVFRKQGVDVVPVAADFQVAGIPRHPNDWSPFPRQSRFVLLALYLHEWIGERVYRWRGWI